MKRLMAVMLLVVFAMTLAVGVNAALPETVEPMWDNITRMTNLFSFNGSSGTSSCTLVARSGTTSIEGTITIYQQIDGEWVFVDSTSDSSSSMVLTMSLTVDGEADGYYMSVFEVTVTRNGIEETASKTAYSYC